MSNYTITKRVLANLPGNIKINEKKGNLDKL